MQSLTQDHLPLPYKNGEWMNESTYERLMRFFYRNQNMLQIFFIIGMLFFLSVGMKTIMIALNAPP